ncbi:MAG: alginate export family protein [Mariprofundus sp.]|nr:alginate export family protein [Mariprofundus sp.]
MKKSALLVGVLCFSSVAQAATWTTSADIRERYQFFDNLNFNSAANSNSWEFDSRLYMKTKADFGNGVSVVLQPQAVLIQNHTVTLGTQDFSQADLLKAYIQYDVGDFGVKLGRQQLVYGDQRLLGHLGWKDVARTFDGAKVMYHAGALKLDAFAVHPSDIVLMTPKTTAPQGSSLVTWEDRTLIGAYGTYTMAPKTGIDTYFINWSHNQQAAGASKGRNVNTYGARLFGRANGFDGTAEAVFQSGKWNNTVNQKASAYAAKVGYTFATWKTRLGVEYDFSPGDDKTSTTHKSFVFPFHTNHAHYGEMDRFSWANMKDLRLSLKTSPAKGFTLIGNVHFLTLDKAQGDWLNVVGAGNLFAGASTYTQTKAGTEIDLKAVYKVAAVKGLKLVALYSVFNPGAAVAERNLGKADSASFGYLIANYKF